MRYRRSLPAAPILPALILPAMLLGSLAMAPAAKAQNAIALYGPRIAFKIFRKGSRVGTQSVTFALRNGTLFVSETSDISIHLLLIPVYHFHYHMLSQWRDGAMVSLQATTNDDGKISTVTARTQGGHTIIDGPAGHIVTPAPILPVAHWDMATLKQKALLNTITGKVDREQITEQGANMVQTPQGTRRADRYTYQGDLRLTSWYDSAGHWVGLRFAAKDGSSIDYLCELCGAPPG